MADKKQIQILLINDMAGYGKVALSVMIPVLSHLKFETFNLPTALVSNTLDYGQFDIQDSTLQIFFILSNKKTYNLLYLLYSISANKSLQKQEIVCHAYFTTETILLTSFFGSFGIIFRMPQCHLRKICSCWSFPCWPWILSAPSGLHGCI